MRWHVKAIYMSERKPRKRKSHRRGYHHGDLAEAMVAAALKLTAEFGPAGFTFAEVTRIVGVSAAAPYRHFRDREALMAFIALRGFKHFAAALEKAWNDGVPDPRTAFMNVGHAYLAFAQKEPAYYAAMFEARLPLELQRDVVEAGERAFAVLRTAAEALIQELPEDKRPPVMMMSLHIWSMTHGIAALFGKTQKMPSPFRWSLKISSKLASWSI